jgi:hypothetical protein
LADPISAISRFTRSSKSATSRRGSSPEGDQERNGRREEEHGHTCRGRGAASRRTRTAHRPKGDDQNAAGGLFRGRGRARAPGDVPPPESGAGQSGASSSHGGFTNQASEVTGAGKNVS